MVQDVAEEAVERVEKCVKWSKGWAEAAPDPTVADAVENGLVTLGCLPTSRLERMLRNEVLEPSGLSESQMTYLQRQGLLDPEEVETVEDDEEEDGDDDGDDGGVSLDDLDDEERELLVEEVREEIEEEQADDADEEPEAEEEPAGLEDFRSNDDQDESGDEKMNVSDAM